MSIQRLGGTLPLRIEGVFQGFAIVSRRACPQHRRIAHTESLRILQNKKQATVAGYDVSSSCSMKVQAFSWARCSNPVTNVSPNLP